MNGELIRIGGLLVILVVLVAIIAFRERPRPLTRADLDPLRQAIEDHAKVVIALRDELKKQRL